MAAAMYLHPISPMSAEDQVASLTVGYLLSESARYRELAALLLVSAAEQAGAVREHFLAKAQRQVEKAEACEALIKKLSA